MTRLLLPVLLCGLLPLVGCGDLFGLLDRDLDGDGYTPDEGDCNDDDPNQSPTATDIFGDDIDQNCDGADGFDGDGDGDATDASGGGDCDDTDPSIHSGAEEISDDGIDQDCDGVDLTSYIGGWQINACEEPPSPTGHEVGDVVDDIVLFDQFGDLVSLYDFCGDAVLITMGAFW